MKKVLLHSILLFSLSCLAFTPSGLQAQDATGLELLEVKKIWDYADYNSFTDLVWFRGYFYCSFREGHAHAGGDQGKVRILRSRDGREWLPVAFFSIPVKEGTVVFDLRDPKLGIAHGDSLVCNMGVTLWIEGKPVGMAPRVASSRDGLHWSDPEPVSIHDRWPWHPVWHGKYQWVVSYRGDTNVVWLERSEDGFVFLPVATLRTPRNRPNEVTLRFDRNDRMVGLFRTAGGDRSAFLGLSVAPYTRWRYHALGKYVGGPDLLVLAPGHYLCAGRMMIGGKPKTCVARLDEQGHMSSPLVLPSGGDNSYPGMVVHNGILWVSYYSSHEGKAGIYLARIRLKG